MRVTGTPQLRELLEDAACDELDSEREEIRREAQENLAVIQQENRRSFNKRRRAAIEYAIDGFVAIKRTQYGSGLKLRPKFLGPYKVIKKTKHGRYEVAKVGSCTSD